MTPVVGSKEIMNFRESIKPIADKLQNLTLTIINPETVIEKIKTSCQNELDLRGNEKSNFDSGVKYMAYKILKILNENIPE